MGNIGLIFRVIFIFSVAIVLFKKRGLPLYFLFIENFKKNETFSLQIRLIGVKFY